MEKLEELKQKLNEKVWKEYNDFIEELKKCKPETIIERAYEKVSKEEIIYKVLDQEYEIGELKALLKNDGILEECYDEWLKSDGNFHELLEFAVDSRIEKIISDYTKQRTIKSKESR